MARGNSDLELYMLSPGNITVEICMCVVGRELSERLVSKINI